MTAMTKIVNQEQFNQSMEAKGKMCYDEKKRLLFFGLPWTFTRYELRENVITILNGFFTVHENDCYMYKISDVEITSSLGQRIFGCTPRM